jgi:methylglutaconyl-CoA hydratase
VFDAAEAYRIGYVHELVAAEELDVKVDAVLAHLLQGAPIALEETKKLLRDVTHRDIDDALGEDTAARIARVRASDEAQEGIKAFFEKRPPAWVKQ